MIFKYCIKIFLLILFPIVLNAQDSSYTPMGTQKHKRYGFAFGYNPIILVDNYSELNLSLKSAGLSPFSSNNFSSSFLLYVYSGIIRDLRIGILWSGSDKSTENEINSVKKEFHLLQDIKAILIDYCYPIYNRTGLSLGLLIGSGEITHSLSSIQINEKTYNDFWNEFENGIVSPNYKRNLTTRQIIYSPSLSLEYALWDFTGLRFGVGYLGSIAIKSKFEDFYELKDSPKSTEFHHIYFHAGIMIGIFMN